MKIGQPDKRFLFITSLFPLDPKMDTHGVYQRMGMFFAALKQIGTVNVLLFTAKGLVGFSDEEKRKRIAEIWGSETDVFLCRPYRALAHNNIEKVRNQLLGVASPFWQPKYISTSKSEQRKALEICLRNRPDAIFVFGLNCMCPILKGNITTPPVFFDFGDIDHILLSRNIKWQQTWRNKIITACYLPSLIALEKRAVSATEQVFVCSEIDKKHLEKFFHTKKCVAIPNAVRIPEKLPLPTSPTILFIGSFDYEPNVIGAEYMINKIWPIIHAEMPEAHLFIAGKGQGNIKYDPYSIPKVTFMGYVEDLVDLYRSSRISCVPILSGGGTRIKILEAASYGKAVVSTSIGAEGIEMMDGRDILIQDSPSGFAEACIRLLRDDAFCASLGDAAHKVISRLYNQRDIISIIQKSILNARQKTPTIKGSALGDG